MKTRKKWLHDATAPVPRRTKYRRLNAPNKYLVLPTVSDRKNFSFESKVQTNLKTDNILKKDSLHSEFEIQEDCRNDIPQSNQQVNDFEDHGSVEPSSIYRGNIEDTENDENHSIEGPADKLLDNVHNSSDPVFLEKERDPETNTDLSNQVDFVILVEAYCHRFRLSEKAVDSLLQLLHLSFGLSQQEKQRLPTTVYKLRKRSYNLSKFGSKLGWICTQCGTEVYCEFEDRKTPNEYCFCAECNVRASTKDNYFVTISLERTLQYLLNNNKDIQDATISVKCPHETSKMNDVCCGTVYQKVLKEHSEKSNVADTSVLTVMMNTDGAPVFSSSKCSVWPILLTINELPPIKRKNNVLCVGLWFGTEKPHFESFMKTFIMSMKTLQDNPIIWTQGKHIRKTTVYCIGGLADSVARPVLQNVTQFNGAYGCQCCEHPGQSLKKNAGHVKVYDPLLISCLRNIQSHAEYAQLASDGNFPVKGVKGSSCLSNIPLFNIIDNMPIDYMHAVLMGIVRTMTGIWFSPAYSSQPFSLKNHKEDINFYLLNTFPHNLLSRTPRKIDDMAFWKAHEWRNWLLYYSPVILNNFWPENIYNNWCLLSNTIHILSRSGIGKNDIENCRNNITSFVTDFRAIYGLENCSYNLHILTHICDSVERYGPLYGFSLFTFENFNQILLKSKTGTQAVPSQMIKYYLQDLYLKHKATVPGDTLTPLYNKLIKPTPTIKQTLRNVDLEDIGLSMDQLQLLTNGKKIIDCVAFSRYKHKQFTIQAETYSRCLKRDSSWVFLSNNTIMNIQKFIKIRVMDGFFDFALGDVYEKVLSKLSSAVGFENHIEKLCVARTYGIVPIKMIGEPAMYMHIQENKFVLHFPNLVEIKD